MKTFILLLFILVVSVGCSDKIQQPRYNTYMLKAERIEWVQQNISNVTEWIPELLAERLGSFEFVSRFNDGNIEVYYFTEIDITVFYMCKEKTCTWRYGKV